MNQRKASARYYLFEDVLWETPGFARVKQIRPIAELQVLAALVWAREGKGACPEVRARDHKDHSYYEYGGHIYLARAHRSIGGVLHELAHALGPNDKLTHGPAFRARCMRLYEMYGDWNGRICGDDAPIGQKAKR